MRRKFLFVTFFDKDYIRIYFYDNPGMDFRSWDLVGMSEVSRSFWRSIL